MTPLSSTLILSPVTVKISNFIAVPVSSALKVVVLSLVIITVSCTYELDCMRSTAICEYPCSSVAPFIRILLASANLSQVSG